MVMNTGASCSMAVCVPDVQEQPVNDQNPSGTTVIGPDDSVVEDFDSALGMPNGYTGCGGSNSDAGGLPVAEDNNPISETGPVNDSEAVTPGVTGADQSPRVGDLDVDTLIDITTNPTFQDADPEMQKMALNAALSHEDPNMALDALNNLVQSDLFQGQGLEGVLSEQEMGSLRSVLLGMYGLFAKAPSGQAGSASVPGMGETGVGQGMQTPPAAPPEPAPTAADESQNTGNNPGQGGGYQAPVEAADDGSDTTTSIADNDAVHNCGGAANNNAPRNDSVTLVGAGGESAYSSGNTSAGGGVSVNTGAGSTETDTGSTPVAGTAPFAADGGFAQFAQVLQETLGKLGNMDQENGTNHTQDFLNMFMDAVSGLATDLGAEGAEDIVGSLGNLPTVGTPIDSAPLETQPLPSSPAEGTSGETNDGCTMQSEQEFMSAFSQVL